MQSWAVTALLTRPCEPGKKIIGTHFTDEPTEVWRGEILYQAGL